jgi:hypothetical protein
LPTVIHAVHDDDLNEFLNSINLLEKFKAGRLKCTFCQDAINMENLYSIYPDSGDIKLSCSKPECIFSLKSSIEGKKYG